MNILILLVFGIFFILGSIQLALGILEAETVFIVTGALCLSIAFLILYLSLRSRFRERRLKKNGRKVWALVTDWQENDKEDAERAREEGTDFLVTFTLEAEGKTYTCMESTEDPDSYMGRTVPIYFSGKNAQNYRIELSEIR